MSKKNSMKELLNDVEVDWKPLGEISEIFGGLKGKTKPDFEDGNAKYVSYKNIFRNIEIDFDNLEYVKVSASENQNEVKYGDILFTASSESQDEVGMSSSITANSKDKVYLNSFSFGVRFNDDIQLKPEFSKYLFRSHFIRAQIKKTASGVTRFNISKARFKKIVIPIPPLDIQTEIVRILDNFTELTTELTVELTAELTSRKKQYSYYLDKLFTFEDREVQWKSLGELFEFKNGISKGKEFFGKGDKIINFTDVIRNSKLFDKSINGKVITNQSDVERFNCKKGDVFFTRTSETKEEIGYTSVLLSDIPICVFSGFLIRARPLGDSLLPEYCAYCFSSYEIRKKIISTSNMTTRVTTTGTILSKLIIPIPSIEQQQRIVDILDKFNTLTNSISEGLPKEIELRQKQYEYYRDLLLTFPKDKK